MDKIKNFINDYIIEQIKFWFNEFIINQDKEWENINVNAIKFTKIKLIFLMIMALYPIISFSLICIKEFNYVKVDAYISEKFYYGEKK